MDKELLENTISGLLSILPAIRRFVVLPTRSNFGPLNHRQFMVLSTLEAKSTLSMSALAEIVAVSNQQLTALISSLVDEGLVKRNIDPTNRRVTLVAVTQSGIKFIDQKKKLFVEQLVPFFEKYSYEEIMELSNSAKNILQILEK